MNPVLQIFFIICIVVFIALIVHYISRQRLNLKYSLVWLASGVGMLILAIFPGLVDKLGALVGIASPTSTVFLFAGMFMLAIIFTLTIIVSHMNQRIYRLTQNQALLEKRIRDMENGKNNTGGGVFARHIGYYLPYNYKGKIIFSLNYYFQFTPLMSPL